MFRFPAALTALLALLVCTKAHAQSFALDMGNVSPGRYVIEVTVSDDGTVSAKSLQIVRLHGAPRPEPPDPDDPAPVNLTAKVSQWSKEVTGDPKREETALHLAKIYDWIGEKVQSGEMEPSVAKALVRMGIDKTLEERKVTDAWGPFLASVTGELNRIEQAGQLNLAKAYGQIAAGLVDIPEAQRERVSTVIGQRLDIAKIMKIIEMLYQFWLLIRDQLGGSAFLHPRSALAAIVVP